MIHNFLYIIIVRLTYKVFPTCDVNVIKRVFKTIFQLLKKNGTLFTVKYLKQSRLLITRYLCGKPLYVNNAFVSTKSGFPTKFIYLKKYIDSDKIEHIKFALTLLNISRTITPRKGEVIPIDFSSIIDGPKKRFKTVPGSFIKLFINEFKLDWTVPTYSTSDFFISLKMGPHGPTILSITETVKWLTGKQLQYIHTLINGDFFSKYIGPFYSFMKHNNIRLPNGSNTEWNMCSHNPLNNKNTGRLSIVKDPECKMRIIAISDYFTQFTLKPIHKKLMKLLSLMPCDRTFTQDPFHKWEGSDPFYSLDLSSATDRFPVHLQQKLLTYLVSTRENLMFSYKYSEAWMKLLTDRVFTYDDYDYKYAVGQPMGAYSSWAAFTLSHHLVVQFCAYKLGKFPFTNYIILGDDIVVKDTKVAKSYISFMTKLGVDISPHKTHVSNDTYEFAKRWIRWTPLDGFKEISPLPLKGIGTNIDNPFIVFTILFDYFIVKRNSYLSSSNLVSLVVRLYNNLSFKYFVKGKLQKKVTFNSTYLRAKLNMLELSMRFSLDLITDTQIRFYLCKVMGNHDWYPIPNDSTILKREFLRVLGISIYPAIMEGMSNLSKLKRRSMQYWALAFNQPSKLDVFPLFHAINNWAKELNAYLNKIENSESIEKLTLFNIYKMINFIDLNELLMWDRNYHSNLAFGGKLLSQAKRKLQDTSLDMFYYDIFANDRELLDKIGTMSYNTKQFLDYTNVIEQRIAKPLPPKQVEMFKQLASRHNYAFLQ